MAPATIAEVRTLLAAIDLRQGCCSTSESEDKHKEDDPCEPHVSPIHHKVSFRSSRRVPTPARGIRVAGWYEEVEKTGKDLLSVGTGGRLVPYSATRLMGRCLSGLGPGVAAVRVEGLTAVGSPPGSVGRSGLRPFALGSFDPLPAGTSGMIGEPSASKCSPVPTASPDPLPVFSGWIACMTGPRLRVNLARCHHPNGWCASGHTKTQPTASADAWSPPRPVTRCRLPGSSPAGWGSGERLSGTGEHRPGCPRPVGARRTCYSRTGRCSEESS